MSDALACLALSALCFSRASSETLFRADWDFYNRLLLGAPTLGALILNIVTLAAGGFLGAQAIRRRRRPVSRRLAAVAAAATLLIALNFTRIAYETAGRWTDAIGRPGLLALVVLILAASLGWPRPTLQSIRGVALVASPLAVVTLAHALWMFLELTGGPGWRRVDPAPLKGTAPSLRRVVWLVFEELDQGITFETRPTGLELPELDRLRGESLYADAARPPAGTTEVSMPALITGRPVVAVVPVSPNDLELTFADGKTARWSAHPNVFSRARVFGYDTALIGWHLPYPRVLGGSLGAADWRPSVAYEQTRGDTFSQALRNQWGSLAPPVHVRRLSARRFAELGDLAIRTATDSRFGLVLLHLPLPQTPGIYDRATGRLTPWNFSGVEAEYLDNLALADRVVGKLRRGLDRARLGDRTWIVVSSDRWWRGSKRADGQVDHRVPFLVRPPDGGRRAHVDRAFNTLGTHDLVLAILRGSISDTASAATWLTRSPSAPPTDYTSQGRPIY
ncbi:MAG TPA: sulfatase-like hydrolase/transferase [Gemmatimonadaceae bacterium]|nr:sulfatase-like hydrolase/transferase [Gemmatimonadaceae bacterium]